jgi:SAM-dependent methyltransferase
VRSRLGRKLWWRLRGVPSEVAFWSKWFDRQGGMWGAGYRKRLSHRPIADPLVTEAILDRSGPVSIIDVGAGPLTYLGTSYPGRDVTVVPVDPLAPLYDRLIERAGVEPPLRTMNCAGERLVETFGEGKFDIAHARNAIDHSAEPFEVICNMLEVVKPDGVVLLRHLRNEGESASYHGFHQWNFDVSGEHLVLWTSGCLIDVTRELVDVATVEAWLEPSDEGPEVVARLRPLGLGVSRRPVARRASTGGGRSGAWRARP